jgi:DNA invertase Pin-like site-specific DNA recombinase
MVPAPDYVKGEAAARMLAAGRPPSEVAQALGCQPSHVRRFAERALKAREQRARAELDDVHSLRTAALGGDR